MGTIKYIVKTAAWIFAVPFLVLLERAVDDAIKYKAKLNSERLKEG